MKQVPTVVASGRKAIEILEFEGSDRIPNRDAVGFYFTVRLAPDRDKSRVSVVFSGTVMFIEPTAFGMPEIKDRNERFGTYAEAALGDSLQERGLPAFTPSGVNAHQIEAFSPLFQDWSERRPAGDDEIEGYMQEHVFAAWTFGQESWEVGLSDSIRLRRPLSFIDRIINLGAGRDWEVIERSQSSVRLRPLAEFLRRMKQPPAAAPAAAVAEAERLEAEEVSEPSLAFVDETRIADLKRTRKDNFDARKLVALCEELNLCYRSQCYHAVAALTRALLDHVPPIFGAASFAEVANNYSGGKTFRECMQHLENTARKIGDLHLHTQIRQTEALPTRTQVNFSHEVDLLLAEAVRVLGVQD